MAQEFRISVDLSELLNIGPMVKAGVFQNLSGAVEQVAVAGVERWRQAVGVQKLWSQEKQEYQRSIQYQMTGPYSAVVWSDYKYVEDIESGRPAYDLKRMLDTSSKVRRTKAGKRFMVIPMRHNVSTMSPDVYAAAQDLAPSKIAAQTERPAGQVTLLRPNGMRAAPKKMQTPFLSNPKTQSTFMVTRNHYDYGDRMTRKMLAAAGASKADQKRLNGLYRFDTSSGKSNSSAYLNFRIMMEGSSKWVIPARPGLWIAKAVSESLQRTAATDFAAAMQMDLAA